MTSSWSRTKQVSGQDSFKAWAIASLPTWENICSYMRTTEFSNVGRRWGKLIMPYIFSAPEATPILCAAIPDKSQIASKRLFKMWEGKLERISQGWNWERARQDQKQPFYHFGQESMVLMGFLSNQKVTKTKWKELPENAIGYIFQPKLIFRSLQYQQLLARDHHRFSMTSADPSPPNSLVYPINNSLTSRLLTGQFSMFDS